MSDGKQKKSGLTAGKKSTGGTPALSSTNLRMLRKILAGQPLQLDKIQPNKLAEAQEIIYDAWDAPTRKKAVALAKKALTISPDCADAYVLLANETAASIEEAIDLCRDGVKAGENALGKKGFKEMAGHFWGFIETRPYMRARATLAQNLWEAGEREEAIGHYWDMLRLNPNDNQGNRNLLMKCLLELGLDADAEKLFKRYKRDGSAFWKYSRALLDFRKSGDSRVAQQSLQTALDVNGHVPAYLTGKKKMPRSLPDYYHYGGKDEAVLYAKGSLAAWKATPGALEWLGVVVE